MNKYPDYLNPFDDDTDEPGVLSDNEYPEYLDPFRDHEDKQSEYTNLKDATKSVEDYDDSLNPFGDEEDDNHQIRTETQETSAISSESIRDFNDLKLKSVEDENPFGESKQANTQNESLAPIEEDKITSDETNTASRTSLPTQLDSLEPPKPLPRTKSLLKKEHALKRLQQEQQNHQSRTSTAVSNDQENDLRANNNSNLTSTSTKTVASFQRKKNKRAAPPVPVNFKRQVSGSLGEIEVELNGIGDQLAIIEQESNECQEMLKSPDAVEQADFSTTRSSFIKLIKRKNSLIRRQKELMYKKRELKLDQIHSDIEYELRMIGNKQLSTRTSEDEAKEKELLKKLVEIVEEKSDIVENLNKDTSRDSQDIEEALRRLNLAEYLHESLDKNSLNSSISNNSPLPPSGIATRRENCDKISLNKFSKIATLLPKSNTLKGTIKLKHKLLFKKNHDSQPPNTY